MKKTLFTLACLFACITILSGCEALNAKYPRLPDQVQYQAKNGSYYPSSSTEGNDAPVGKPSVKPR